MFGDAMVSIAWIAVAGECEEMMKRYMYEIMDRRLQYTEEWAFATGYQLGEQGGFLAGRDSAMRNGWGRER